MWGMKLWLKNWLITFGLWLLIDQLIWNALLSPWITMTITTIYNSLENVNSWSFVRNKRVLLLNFIDFHWLVCHQLKLHCQVGFPVVSWLVWLTRNQRRWSALLGNGTLIMNFNGKSCTDGIQLRCRVLALPHTFGFTVLPKDIWTGRGVDPTAKPRSVDVYTRQLILTI